MAAASNDLGPHYSLNGLRIFVVEDNRFVLDLFCRILNSFGANEVGKFDLAEDALREFEKNSADILLVDWEMQPMSGIDLARKVRSEGAGQSCAVPIIMITGHTALNEVQTARDSGITEILSKPLAPKVLYDRIVSVIERPRPFIRTHTFIGPDRRRREVQFEGEERRAAVDGAA